MTDWVRLGAAILAGVVAACGPARPAMAQTSQGYVPPGPPVMAAQPAGPALLTDDQLDQLLAPVALYPDPLLAQILPASTYPLEVVAAAQWIAANPQAYDTLIDAQAWEPSVRALAHYPEVLQTMSEHAEWMQALGAAFMNQRHDVMDAIQRLRQLAIDSGNLQSTPQQQVIVIDGLIAIMPTDEDVICVPQYDVAYVYVRHEGDKQKHPWKFGPRRRVGRWLDNGMDWYSGWVIAGGGWRQGWGFLGGHWWRQAPSEPGRWTPGGLDNPPWRHNPGVPTPMLPPGLLGGPIVVEPPDDPGEPSPPSWPPVNHGPVHPGPPMPPGPVHPTPVEPRGNPVVPPVGVNPIIVRHDPYELPVAPSSPQGGGIRWPEPGPIGKNPPGSPPGGEKGPPASPPGGVYTPYGNARNGQDNPSPSAPTIVNSPYQSNSQVRREQERVETHGGPARIYSPPVEQPVYRQASPPIVVEPSQSMFSGGGSSARETNTESTQGHASLRR